MVANATTTFVASAKAKLRFVNEDIISSTLQKLLQVSSWTRSAACCKRVSVGLATLLLQVVSIWMLLVIAGVLPVPCQGDLGIGHRLSTLIGVTNSFIGKFDSLPFGKNNTIPDIFCWM